MYYGHECHHKLCFYDVPASFAKLYQIITSVAHNIICGTIHY